MMISSLRYLAFTEKGKALADVLAAALGGSAMRCNAPLGLEEWTKAAFSQADGLVFVGAAGIAVRAIAPHLQNKTVDPAVVVVDECAQYAVPVLSGHLGGANDLAKMIAAVCGAMAVLTTATDVNHVFAVDEWAKHQNCTIVNPQQIKTVSSALLSGETVRVKSAWPVSGVPPAGLVLTEDGGYDVLLGVRTKGRDVLRLVPNIAVLGVGCKKETTLEALEQALRAVLAKASMHQQAVFSVSSIDLKKDEPGLNAFCKAHGWNLQTYSAAQLQKAVGNFTASAFVQKITSVDNVCERSAVLASGGTLYQKKDAGNGVTMAIALKAYHPDWRFHNE